MGSGEDIAEIIRQDTKNGVIYFSIDQRQLGMLKKFLARAIKTFCSLIFLVLFCFLTSAQAWTEIGFNFRYSSNGVVDGTNEYPVYGHTYPTTYGEVTAGFTAALADGTRDREPSIDRRLTGVNSATNLSPRTWRVAVDEAGVYTICMAIGDYGSDHVSGPQHVEIYDQDTLEYTIHDNNGTINGHFDDAFGNDKTTATWPAGNQCRGYEISGSYIDFKLGAGTGNDSTTIAHIKITKGGEVSPPTTTTSSTTTTTLPDFAGTFATIEDLCPGGSNHRSDIQWCVNLENLTHCITGQEAQCMIDNGVDSLNVINSKGFKALTCPDTAGVGLGCMFGSGDASGTGAGYATKDISGNPRAVNYRGMVKFGDGFYQSMLNTGHHGPGLVYNLGVGDSDPDCAGYLSWDWTNSNFRVIVEINKHTGCGANYPIDGSFNLVANVNSTWAPKNGKWYTWEIRGVMNDTATTDQPDGGNGVIEFFIDGNKILSYNNVNILGVTPAAGFKSVFLARQYSGNGIARSEPIEYYDAFAVSDTGTLIGVSPNKNLSGAGDPSSPYWYAVAGDGAEQHKLASDCQGSSSATHYSTANEAWRDGFSFVTSPDANDYACTAACVASGCTTTNAIKSLPLTAGSGAGVVYYLTGVGSSNAHDLVMHHNIWLPSGGNWTTPFPLSGFARYGGDGMGGSNWANYVGLSVVNGHWGIATKADGAAGTPLESAVNVTFNTYHDFELHVKSNNTITLYIDDVKVLDSVTPDIDAGTILFNNVDAGPQSAIIGIIADSPDNTTYTVSDDMDIGGASFISCDGWGSSCPIHTLPVSTGSSSTGRNVLWLLKKLKEGKK